MDDHGNILPQGEMGEIVLRGEHVLKSYGNMYDDTHIFVKGWFRTGDLGYIDSDAYLYITDRVTEIINQGGQKISPYDIEEMLLQHPLVRDAAAFAVPHRSLGQALAVLVVAEREGVLSEKDLRRFLADRLTFYKVPQQIIFVENIPKSEIGKVQRNELAHLFSHLLKPEYVPPSTETEQIVAGIWREVLELDTIGMNDNLIALGGDSIHATRIISRINNTFKLQLTLQSMFELPTLYALSEVIDAARFTTGGIQEEGGDRVVELEEGTL
jgi:acyl carrier protein